MYRFADLYKVFGDIGKIATEAGLAMRKLVRSFNPFPRYAGHCVKMTSLWWDLHNRPNNERKMSGEPLIRRRAYEKAYKNERRRR